MLDSCHPTAMALADKKNKVIISGNVLLYEAKAPYTPSGQSLKGVLEYDPDEDKVKCHECGKWFSNIATHLRSHGLTAAEYKSANGLQPGSGLICERLRIARIRTGKRNYAAGKFKPQRQQKRSTMKRRLSAMRKGNSAEYQNARRICPAQLLERIKKCAAAVGRTPSARELREHRISDKTIVHRFGSLKNAVALAGLIPRQSNADKRAHYSKEFLAALIRNFIKAHGRVPSASDCIRGLLPSIPTFISRFGSWSKAIAASGFIPPGQGAHRAHTRYATAMRNTRTPIPVQKAHKPKKAARAHA